MNFIRAYNRCAALLMMLAITAYTTAAYQANHAAPLLAVIGLPAAIAAWWLSARGRLLLPRWIVNVLLGVALLYALLRVLAGQRVEAIAELVVFIQVIKIGDRRSARDDAQILSLSVFLAIAAMLTSNDFWTGLQLIALVPLLIGTVMLFQVYSGWSAAGGGAIEAAPGARPLLRSIRATAVFATGATAVMSVLIFVLVPRGIGENALGNWRPMGRQQQTGFTDHVKLGSRSVISTSQKVVMEVLVRESAGPSEPPGVSLSSAETVYYLRGAVLDKYQNGAWTPDPGEEGESQRRIRYSDPPDEPIPLGQGARASIEQVVMVRDIAENLAPLFTIWRPVQVSVGRGSRAVDLDTRNKTARRTGSGGAFIYHVWSTMAGAPAPADAERTPASFDSTPIHDLAAGVLRAAGIEPDPELRPLTDDARAARTIEGYLQHNYTYSLEEQGTPEGRDPIEQFLLTTKEGHCEYFAAAMTAMCRSVGINARMIAGYVAAEFSETTGRYVVREANAHAWVEAEAGQGRWLRFDPTPPTDLTRLHKPVPGLFGRLRRAVESAEYAWNASVVSFDEGARQRLLGPESDARPGLLTRLDRISERIRAAGPRHFVRSLMMGLVVFLGVAVVGLVVQGLLALVSGLRWWPRRRSRKTAARADAVQARFYRRLLELLARRGHAKPAWRPPLEHAAAIAPADAVLAEAAETVSGLYYRFRFAGRDLTDRERAEVAALLERVSEPLKRKAKRSRG